MTQTENESFDGSNFREGFWKSAPAAEAVLPRLSSAELPDSEFRMLADNLPTLCWVANGDGYIVWYNRRWHEYCGTSPEEMEGWGWQSVHDPEVLPSVLERWTASIAEGQPFEMTFPLRGADGVYRPFLTRIQPVRDASGQIARWFGVNTEVSGQLAAETALARREARLSAFFDQAAAGMSETDREGRFLQVNDRYCEITGRPRSELLGRRMQELTHPDDLGNNLPLFQTAVGEGGGFDIEKRYLRPDGSEVWVHNSVTAVREPGGQVERTVCVTIDISARRAAEEQLRRNHSTFYDLIQNNPFGVYVVDSDFRLAEVSLGAQKVFENVRPLLGRDFAEVLRIIWAEPFATEAVGLFRHTLDTGEPYSSPSTMEPRGDIDAVEAYDWRIERLELPDGRFGVVCYFYDLSERHLWETALRDASERIELALDAGAIAGTWVWEVANDRFTADDRFARSFGVDAEACRRGLPLSEVSQSIHTDDWPVVEKLIAQALAEGGPYRAEYRVRQLTGEYHWVEAVGRCDLDDDGKPVRFPGVIADIDARKRDEDALRESECVRPPS